MSLVCVYHTGLSTSACTGLCNINVYCAAASTAATGTACACPRNTPERLSFSALTRFFVLTSFPRLCGCQLSRWFLLAAVRWPVVSCRAGSASGARSLPLPLLCSVLTSLLLQAQPTRSLRPALALSLTAKPKLATPVRQRFSPKPAVSCRCNFICCLCARSKALTARSVWRAWRVNSRARPALRPALVPRSLTCAQSLSCPCGLIASRKRTE